MASFTDIVPQFNPYVSSLPVEAIAQVGMYKQQKYEENVTKIQDQIDKIAGLDIYKNVDKQYLQSKMDELGSSLRTFAAGDFSNFQLVNSVSGMTKQVVNDKNIQTAVASTARMRSENKAMEDAIKAGKSNIANEDLYMSQIKAWENDGKVGSAFTGSYTPYTDVFKKLTEIAKSVGEDSTIVQQLFQTDANGNPILVNGKLQYNDVMAETLLKGKNKEKLLEAFRTGLDSNDYRQLSISGRYELKGKSHQELLNTAADSFNSYQKLNYDQQDHLKDEILKLKSSGGDQDMIDAMEKQVAQLNDSLGKRRKETEALVNIDPDALRGSIYTNNYLDSISSSLSNKETYTKYSENPGVKVMLDRERLKLDVQKENRAWAEFDYKKKNDLSERNFQKWKTLFEAGLVDEEGNPTGASVGAGAMRDVPPSDVSSTYFSNAFEEGLQKDMSTQRDLYEKVAIAHWMATNSGKIDPATGKPFTTEGIKREISKWADKKGMSYNDYIVLQGEKALDYYHNTKTPMIGEEYAQDFAKIDNLKNTIALKTTQQEKANDFVKQNAQGVTPIDLQKLDIKPVKVMYAGEDGRGHSVVLSKQDILDVASYSYHAKDDPFMPRVFDSNAVSAEAKGAYDRLSKKYGKRLADYIVNDLYGSTPDITNLWSLQTARPQNKELTKAMSVIGDANYSKSRDLKEQYFKSISNIAAPKNIILYKNDEKQEKALSAKLSSVASDYIGVDDDFANIAALSNQKESHFQIQVIPATDAYGKNTYMLQAFDKDNAMTSKAITEDQFKLLTGRKDAPTIFVNGVENAYNTFGSTTGSTNSQYSYTDADNASRTAYIKAKDLQYVKQHNVAIDYAKGSDGYYFPKIYVQTGNTWKLIPYPKGLTAEESTVFHYAIDDNLINSLLSKK